jgi:RNA polymerase sigma-70 factor (ECF subfamily)
MTGWDERMGRGMDETTELVARRFEAERPRLKGLAIRMLGSASEADDVVQEAWLRLDRADPETVDNLRGWLTTVVARLCLNVLQARRTRREQPLETSTSAAREGGVAAEPGPEDETLIADAVGPALLIVLDTLTPAERLAFVLHDVFAVPFDEIAPIIDKTPAATRQLASRARRRVQGVRPRADETRARRQAIVSAFLAASREGRFEELLRLLDPEAVIRADATAVRMGGVAAEVRGARGVAGTFSGRAHALRLALLDGLPGLIWTLRGEVKVAFAFTIEADRVTGIEMLADPERLSVLSVEPLASNLKR